MSLTAREAKKEVAYTGILHIHLIDGELYRWRYGRRPFAPHRWQKGLKSPCCQLWVLEKEKCLSWMIKVLNMRKITFLMALMLSVCPLGAGMWVSARELTPRWTLEYSRKDTSALFMDIYSPVEGSVTEIDGRRKPTILYIFGGGFMEGNRRDGTAMEWFRDLTDDGYGVVAIDYRLGLKGVRGVTASEFVVLLERAINLAVEDLFSATSYLIEHRDDLGIDPSALVVAGSSAGAITALQAEYEICNGTPVASVLPEGFNYAGVMSFAGAILVKGGSIEYARRHPCPTMMLHGTDDDLVPYSRIDSDGYSFCGVDAIAKVFSGNGFDYRAYRYLSNNHSVAGFMHFTLDLQKSFLERNVMARHKLNVDALIEDPSLPYYPSGNSNLYDIR